MTAGLAEQIAGVHAGQWDGAALVGEFRRSVLLVPTDGQALWTGDFGGVRWVYAFTGEGPLARFAAERGIGPGREVPYVSVYGARLLDVAVPATGVPAGVAVDVAGPLPAFLPPLEGIVSDTAAVDGAGAGQ